jgi:8-oxo-dGTP pyrophosphatase MutT (NUDIX family)
MVKSAGIFIVRKDGKVLICHPTNAESDEWSIPKGKVEEDETFIEAAIRETYEETNINLKKNYDFVIHMFKPVMYKHGMKTLYPFLFHEKEDSNFDWDNIEIKCNSNVPEERGGFPEMDDFMFVSLDKAKKYLHSTQVACLGKIKEIIEKTNKQSA